MSLATEPKYQFLFALPATRRAVLIPGAAA